MNPIKYDPDQVPVFSSTDIDDYGLPSLYGYEKFRVVESRELNIKMDYKFSQERQWTFVHRYDRTARFKTTLLNLLGERGTVPSQVFVLVKTFLNPESKNLWNDTRSILKHYKKRKHYDQIPLIIYSLYKKRFFPKITAEKIDDIINDFKAFVSRFDQKKHLYNRKYFPNIRFIVIKLLELHSIVPNYDIPMTRTTRKYKLLSKLWDDLIKHFV